MRQKRRKPLGFIVALFVLLFAQMVFAQPSKNEGPQPVIVASAQLKKLSDRVEALGTLRANESITISATITETVSAINFEDGQRVAADTILAELTSQEEHAQLTEAEVRKEEAERQYKRVQPLAKGGAVPLSVVDERKREYETAVAQLQATKSRLQDRILVAPFAGVVGLRNVSVGALVKPGDTITTLDDDSVMKLDFSVPSVFLPSLKVGMKIEATARALSNHVSAGTVSSIDSRVDPVTRSIVVRALIENSDHLLKPGLLMTVTLLKDEREGLVVPEEALTTEGTSNFVFIANKESENAKAEKRKVTIGARSPGEVEITSGLKAGELVVTDGTHLIRDGQVIKITATKQSGESLQHLLSSGAAS